MIDFPVGNKRILFITPTRATIPFLIELIQRLIDASWEVHYATSSFRFADKTAVDLPPDVRLHEISFARGANPWLHWRASRQVNKLVREIRPDVIDVHFSAAMLTVALARRSDWPTTFATIHGLRFPQQSGIRRQIESRVEGWAGSRMDRVWLLTADDLKALEAIIGIKAALLQSSGLGCDLVRFNPERFTNTDRQRARLDAGVSESETVLIFVGRKVSFKGYDLVVLAFLKALEQRSDLRLLVCGTEDPFHATGLSRGEMDATKSHPKITHLGWIDNVEHFLSISDITLFPSRREGMPVNLMESLAMGVPVITCDSRGCRDIVDHEKTGLVLPTFDAELLSKAILRLVDDDSLRKRLSQNALTKRIDFDRQNFVQERFDLFEQVAQSSRQART